MPVPPAEQTLDMILTELQHLRSRPIVRHPTRTIASAATLAIIVWTFFMLSLAWLAWGYRDYLFYQQLGKGDPGFRSHDDPARYERYDPETNTWDYGPIGPVVPGEPGRVLPRR
jgi:hypothetical protein